MKTRKTKKGFTLMELIIVLAIMGILLAIIVPSWGYFIRSARERSANNRAKIVFNAAQTEVTRMGAKERPLNNIVHNSQSDSEEAQHAMDEIYMGDYKLKDRSQKDSASNREYYDFVFYWDGNEGRRIDGDGNLLARTADDEKFASALNSIIGGEGTYKIYVRNYNVQSVVFSDYENGRYKGTYPVGMDDLTDAARTHVRNTDVQSVNMTLMTLS